MRIKNILKAAKPYIPYMIFILLFPLSLLLSKICEAHPQGTEMLYGRRIYPVLASFFSFFTRWIPFSLAELLIFLIILVVLFLIVRLIIHIRKITVRKTVYFFLKLISAASVIYFLFVVLWGLNYYRQPLYMTLGYKDQSPTKQELVEVLTDQINQINKICPQIHYNNSGHSFYPGELSKMSIQVNDGYQKLSQTYTFINRTPARPKGVFVSKLMSYMGIEGIFIPFTYEPCVNTVSPSFMLPSNMAHETAHFKGFAKEDEANYFAYLANSQNSDAYFQYSAHMQAYIFVSNALFDTDQTLSRKVVSSLDKRAVSDLVYYNQYVNRFAGPVQKASQKINDSYLKSQGQQQGVISYNLFVNLLLDKYRAGK